MDIGLARWHRQLLAEPLALPPEGVVEWLGAVQAQDYAAALWAVGLRSRDARRADVERAIGERRVVRTWPMRGTIHLVPGRDVRWMLALLATRRTDALGATLRRAGLDWPVLVRCRAVMERELAQGSLTRPELYARLAAAGVPNLRETGIHIVVHWAQAGLICYGEPRGPTPCPSR